MTKRYGKSAGELQRWYLREWRKHRGMTQEQLAEAIDSTKQTVSRMESGYSPYNQPFLEACSEALSCSTADLLIGPPADDQRQEIFLKIRKLPNSELPKIIAFLNAFF
nr:helix-turn-helix transcriptional regulator [uncultured Cohaesibacter sp.]